MSTYQHQDDEISSAPDFAGAALAGICQSAQRSEAEVCRPSLVDYHVKSTLLDQAELVAGGLNELILRLETEELLQQLPVQTVREGNELVLVFLFGSFRGAWHFDGRTYAWTPAAYNEVQCRLYSAADAAHYSALTLRPL